MCIIEHIRMLLLSCSALHAREYFYLCYLVGRHRIDSLLRIFWLCYGSAIDATYIYIIYVCFFVYVQILIIPAFREWSCVLVGDGLERKPELGFIFFFKCPSVCFSICLLLTL